MRGGRGENAIETTTGATDDSQIFGSHAVRHSHRQRHLGSSRSPPGGSAIRGSNVELRGPGHPVRDCFGRDHSALSTLRRARPVAFLPQQTREVGLDSTIGRRQARPRTGIARSWKPVRGRRRLRRCETRPSHPGPHISPAICCGLSEFSATFSKRNAQLFHLRTEGIGVDAEQLTGAAGAVDFVFGRLQRSPNVTSDDGVEVNDLVK